MEGQARKVIDMCGMRAGILTGRWHPPSIHPQEHRRRAPTVRNAVAVIIPAVFFGAPGVIGAVFSIRRWRDRPLARTLGWPRPFQHHPVRPRMVNGLVMLRLAQRVASVMSVRPARRRALIARLRSEARTRGPERVRTRELSSR